AQADRLALVVGEQRQGLAQPPRFLPPDGLLAGGGEAGVELLLQRPRPAPGVVERAVPAHVALLEAGVVADGAGDFVAQDALEPGDQLPGAPAGELLEAAVRLQERL